MIPKRLKQNLLNYSQSKEQQTYIQLCKIKAQHLNHDHITFLNEDIFNIVQCSFYDLLQKINKYGNLLHLSSFIRLLSRATSNNQWMTPNIFLAINEWVVEVLCGQQLLIIAEQFQRNSKVMSHLEGPNYHRFHRIINEMLKKLNKQSGAGIVRGKLHILLTKVLKFGHKSGLKQCIKKEFSEPKINPQQYADYAPQLSYKFYSHYVQIINSLTHSSQTNLQLVQHFLSELKQILLSTTFKSNMLCDTPQILSLSSQPGNLIRNAHYVQFRQLLLMKILIYFRELERNLRQDAEIIDTHKILQRVEEICIICQQQIRKISNFIFKSSSVLQMLNLIQKNEFKWNLIKNGKYTIDLHESNENSSKSLIIIESLEKPTTIQAAYQQFREAGRAKLQITCSKMQQFSKNLCTIKLKKERNILPYTTEKIIQNVIDPLSALVHQLGDQQFNCLKWKAMRTLCGLNIQRVSKIIFNEKNEGKLLGMETDIE